MALAIALSSCGGGSAADPVATVPATIQQLLANDFPADGNVHVQARGKMAITPETLFCPVGDGPGLMAGAVTDALGQSYYTNDNIKREVAGPCDANDPRSPVYDYGRQLPNRFNKPYKLVLAVWQGDMSAAGIVAGKGAYWVGSVERKDGLRPDNFEQDRNNPYYGQFKSPFPGTDLRLPGTPEDKRTKEDAIREWVNLNSSRDAQDLSAAFVSHISKHGDRK